MTLCKLLADMKKKADSKKTIVIIGVVWLVLQYILVYYKSPLVFISDEVTYKRIAYNLFRSEPIESLHYPFLYPAIISMGFLGKEHFYEAMLGINILFKGMCLIIIWRLLQKETDRRKATYILVLIAFSPIYFLYSRLLMAENLACPLLIINVLYHEHYRKVLLSGHGGGKTSCTVCAALLSLGLFWTKYLMLVTLPVFCLFWSVECFKGTSGLRSSF